MVLIAKTIIQICKQCLNSVGKWVKFKQRGLKYPLFGHCVGWPQHNKSREFPVRQDAGRFPHVFVRKSGLEVLTDTRCSSHSVQEVRHQRITYRLDLHHCMNSHWVCVGVCDRAGPFDVGNHVTLPLVICLIWCLGF